MTAGPYLFEDYPLPDGFKLPASYLELLAKGLPEIDPWWWLAPYKDRANYWAATLRQQFPSRSLVPFAKHGGSDDVACFDGSDMSGDPKVLYIHAFCSPGWELRGDAENFQKWLQNTEIEAAEFQAGDED
ncbi:SMI1/KNR4 family protein [Inquilinus sp.]|uniref:SMI1/KNR4 family protein n=1 Tax=Inquilinus sp. TaxID=1932117 RepID=UPI0031CF1F36